MRNAASKRIRRNRLGESELELENKILRKLIGNFDRTCRKLYFERRTEKLAQGNKIKRVTIRV